MTNNQVQGSRAKPIIAATQADREAAAAFARWSYPYTEGAGEGILAGQHDHRETVQAFARHRQSSMNELLVVLTQVNDALSLGGRIDCGTRLACRVSEAVAAAQGMSPGTAETGTGSGPQDGQPGPKDAPDWDFIRNHQDRQGI